MSSRRHYSTFSWWLPSLTCPLILLNIPRLHDGLEPNFTAVTIIYAVGENFATDERWMFRDQTVVG